MIMTKQGVIDALNTEGVQAFARLAQLVGFPVLTLIGGIAINQANILITNQEKMFAKQEEHARRLSADSLAINRLVKFDQLFKVKTDATKYALENNSEIGIEFRVDYDNKYEELFKENGFLNP